jgi:hypothetical protein
LRETGKSSHLRPVGRASVVTRLIIRINVDRVPGSRHQRGPRPTAAEAA